MKKLSVLSVFFLLTGNILASQAHQIIVTDTVAEAGPVVEKIIEIGQKDNRTMDHLDILTNRIGGRLSGSDAYANAAGCFPVRVTGWKTDPPATPLQPPGKRLL